MDGIRLDAVNFMMHDPDLPDNPPVRAGEGKRTRPFDFQHHFFNQSHDDIPAFLEELRELADTYPGRYLVAEVGGERAQEEMQIYTRRPGRLHSAYGFLYLYAERLHAGLVREAGRLWPEDEQTGWPSWTFSNHDAPRAVSRWASEADRAACSEMLMLLLIAMRGSIFIYQGEELGLSQAEVPFEALQDPEAIANWPQTLGRDGARTPLPWVASKQNAGFSEGVPWLPVDPRHHELSVDLQNDYAESTLNRVRAILRLRNRYPVFRAGEMRVHDSECDRLLMFERADAHQTLMCVFNLDAEPLEWSVPDGWRVLEYVNADRARLGVLPGWAGLVLERV